MPNPSTICQNDGPVDERGETASQIEARIIAHTVGSYGPQISEEEDSQPLSEWGIRKEIRAMTGIVDALEEMPVDAKVRVLSYICKRYGVKSR